MCKCYNEQKEEVQKLRDRQGHLDKMLSEAAEIVDQQTREIGELQSDVEMFMNLCDKKDEWLEVQRKEIAELKTQISFERVQQQAEVNQLNDDIKFLRSKLPNL
jgi:erythromycin esterase-like protein